MGSRQLRTCLHLQRVYPLRRYRSGVNGSRYQLLGYALQPLANAQVLDDGILRITSVSS